jgi:hypothetical protein
MPLCYTDPMPPQMLIQLQILIAMTPALAGWIIALPAGHPMITHVINMAVQSQGVRGVAVTSYTGKGIRFVRKSTSSPFAVHQNVPASDSLGSRDSKRTSDASCTFQTAFNPFPSCTRAP